MGYYLQPTIAPAREPDPVPVDNFGETAKNAVPQFFTVESGYRFYSPDLGRWLSRDPIGEEGGDNVYGFICNEAVANTDWLGLVLYLEVSFCTGKETATSYLRRGDVEVKKPITIEYRDGTAYLRYKGSGEWESDDELKAPAREGSKTFHVTEEQLKSFLVEFNKLTATALGKRFVDQLHVQTQEKIKLRPWWSGLKDKAVTRENLRDILFRVHDYDVIGHEFQHMVEAIWKDPNKVVKTSSVFDDKTGYAAPWEQRAVRVENAIRFQYQSGASGGPLTYPNSTYADRKVGEYDLLMPENWRELLLKQQEDTLRKWRKGVRQ